MESKAATAWLLLLAVVAAGEAALPPASSAAKLQLQRRRAVVAAASLISTAAWVEDAVEIFPAEARREMTMLAEVVGGGAGSGGIDHELVVHRRVLAGGGYINLSGVPNLVRCFRNKCQGRGRSYTGRGNQCFHNQSCRL
uniref:Uncharacterized protein n=1 Tax=Oryza punctata TaxID=4537 RepID=A0A0E0KPQ8_ORYPU